MQPGENVDKNAQSCVKTLTVARRLVKILTAGGQLEEPRTDCGNRDRYRWVPRETREEKAVRVRVDSGGVAIGVDSEVVLESKADLACRRHCLERARNHLGGAGSCRVLSQLGLEQFGIREDDPQLIIQLVKKQPEVLAHEASLVARSLEREG